MTDLKTLMETTAEYASQYSDREKKKRNGWLSAMPGLMDGTSIDRISRNVIKYDTGR